MKPLCAALMVCFTATPLRAETVADVFELLCNRTLHFYDGGVGNQIEYTSADGAAFLWFNGEPDIITGVWEVLEQDQGRIEICYTYDPQPAAPNGERFCHDYATWLTTIPENGIRDGDPYDLASGQIPFRLWHSPALPPESFDAQFPDLPRGSGCVAFTS